ncbi:MAG: cobalamin-binding protein, partial [Gammaproteobacteria bacterium]
NLTELLFAAGAGDKIIATVRHSDYPAAAGNIPIIGDAHNLDMEAIMLLAPDLILLWESGTGNAAQQKLDELGLTVFRSEPDSLEKIATTIQRFGQLAGTKAIAKANSRVFSRTIARLQQEYSAREPVRVFYQFWNRPIFTVNGHHLISRVIEMCGGSNVFSSLPALTPQISTEAVLAADPDVIIVSGEDETPPDWMADWHRWPELTAITGNHLYSIPPDIILRHTPRIADGAAMMCEFLDRARQ